MTSDPLYPATEAYRSGRLAVGRGHDLYYAEFGNPHGLPALFLHGGPGSGCSAQHARLFDPQRFRLIQLDQRGCGQSKPQGETRDNHTDALLDDLETLRRHLAIDRWLIYGGSWGGTLALEYAKRQPQNVISLVLRAPFLARRDDLDWFTAPTGVAREFPQAYAALRAQLHCGPRDDLIEQLYEHLSSAADLNRTYAAALAWDSWEAAVMGLPQPSADSDEKQRRSRIARKRVYAHYCHNHFFLGSDGVLPGIQRLRPVHATIVHGTQDRVCRFRASEMLLQAKLPLCKLLKVEGAGHAMHSIKLQAALRTALDRTARLEPENDRL